MEETSREVKIGTTTTLSCTISNVLPSGVTAVWKDGDTTINENVDITPVSNDQQQVSTLRISNPQVDKTYSCFITSNTFTDSEESSAVATLGVYGES